MDVHQENETKIDLVHTMEHQFSSQIAQQRRVNDNIMKTPQLSIELTNSTGMYLDHLDDNCLLEIFSKKSLTPVDLCSLAETCTFFKLLTQRIFPKKLAIKYWNWGEELEDYVVIVGSAHDVERIFKNFGSCLIAVACLVGQDTHRTMNLVAKHCVVGTLKELRIYKNEITILSVELKPIFRQLQLLSIIGKVPIQCNATMFEDCGSLTELTIERVCNLSGILENNFPKLQRFKMFYNSRDEGDEGEANHIGRRLLNFCERHQSLKCFHLLTDWHGPMGYFLQLLGYNCKALEELTIELYDIHGTTLDFSYFQNLKRLELRGFSCAKSSVQLQNLKSLEALKIVGILNCEELWKDLPLLQNLRELYLNCLLLAGTVPWASLTQLTKVRLSRNRNVIDMIRQLTNLEELEVIRLPTWRNFILSEKEFFEIAELVKGRPNVLTIKCSFEFSRKALSKIQNTENLNVKLVLATEQLHY